MLISWIQKTTLLDFPWKIACIIFTVWCNLRCKFCYNSEFVITEKIAKIKDSLIPENIFFNFLSSRVWKLDWVVICGWEPTLQNDLIEFCKKIKEFWFLVKLDTNWQNPDILKELLDNKLVDYIAMDIKWDYENMQDLIWKYNKTKYVKSIEIIKNSWIDYEFRTTLIKNYHNKDNFKNTVKQISGSKKYFLQNYKWWNTLQKDFEWKSFLYNELIDFKNIANKYVEKCEIRN